MRTKSLKTAVLCFLVGFCSTVCAQNKELDSLYTALRNHPDKDTVRVKILGKICYREKDFHPEKSRSLAEEIIFISKKINYKKGEYMGYRYMADFYYNAANYPESLRFVHDMLSAAEQLNFTTGIARAYDFLARIDEEQNLFEEAKSHYFKSMELFEKINLKVEVGNEYNNLAGLYFKFKKMDECITMLRKSIAIMKELNDENGISFTLENLGKVYWEKKDYVNALACLESRLPYTIEQNDLRGMAYTYGAIGNTYLEMRQYDKAETNLFQSISFAKKLNDKALLVDDYNTLTKLETKRRKFESALKYSEQALAYRDSSFAEEKAKQLAELETKFESEKKDRAIKELEQREAIQNLNQKYLIAGLVVIICSGLTVYFFQHRYNHKTKLLLQKEEELNLKLQENDKLKSRFFANISHEFRTPLSLIIAPIDEKLSDNDLSIVEQESFQLIKRNAERLLILVNQLLDLSKLEAGKMELHIQCGDIGKFLSVVTASFDSLAETKKLHFEKNIIINSTEHWYDGDKVEIIINNLLSNAFKFTSSNGTISFSAQSTTSGILQLKVADTGRGIPQNELKNVFSPFYQSLSNEDGHGTGLGLSMVNELTKLHGGGISIESEVNKGTVISVCLPIDKNKLPASVEVETSENIPHAKIISIDNNVTDEEENANSTHLQETILIVEDNADLRKFISTLLSPHFHTLVAHDGEEGLALAIEHIPNLIVSDVMMPKLSGVELSKKFKSDERINHIPIVLLTAKADLDSRLAGLKTGADDYLAKPFSKEELMVRITNLIEQRKKLATKYRNQLSFHTTDESSLEQKFLQQAKQKVERSLADFAFGVVQLAEEMNMSRTQLFRKLKAIVGLSPNEFINEIRLQRAAEMLLSKTDTPSQIAYTVGFNDQSYFTKKFKKRFGVVPTKYKDNGTSAT